MEAPDKIFVPTRFRLVDGLRVRESDTDEEYIRKDALMDYFHQRIEELNSPLNGVFGSTERDNCNERISELLLLIDKFNSL
jgi:hypothetical protein